MSFSTTRGNLHFCTGHRLMQHESKCASLHGHNYMVEVSAVAANTDGCGRVVDFGVLKERLGGWIDRYWDHTTILQDGDPLIDAIVPGIDPHGKVLAAWGAGLHDMPLIPGAYLRFSENRPLFIVPFAPSAENLAAFLFCVVCPRVFKDVLGVGRDQMMISQIRLWETANCWVDYPATPLTEAHPKWADILISRPEAVYTDLQEVSHG